MSTKKTKENVSSGPRLSILVGVILAAFLIMQMVGGILNGITTTKALRVTADDSFAATGWFFRDEALVQGTSSETVKHIVRNGEKVRKNAELVIIYTDAAALEISQEAEQLNDEIELLRSALQSSASSGDASRLDQQIASQISAISSKASPGVVTNIETYTTTLRNLCLRRSAGDLDNITLSAELSALTAQRDTLERQLIGRSTTIVSPTSGYFSEIVDGFEDKLTTEALKTLTLDEFAALRETDLKQAEASQLGKIVEHFRWYFVVSAPMSELMTIQKGDALRLRFSQLDSDIAVTAEEIRIKKDEQEGLLILSGMDIVPELVTARCRSAEIIRASTTGLRVPKTSVKIHTDEDGMQQRGVYILTGSVSRFKSIEVLYETDTFYIVKQGTNSKNTGLVAGDNIIVNARGLEDMKVIK